MDTPLPEAYTNDDPRPYLTGPKDTHCFIQYNIGKDEEYIEVPTLVKDPPPSRYKDCRELAPRGVAYQIFDCAASKRQ